MNYYYSYQQRQQGASYTVEEHTTPVAQAAFWVEWYAASETSALAAEIRAALNARKGA